MREGLGRYTILEELGEGPAGAVYRASDNLHSQYVAIRVFDQEHAADPSFKERLGRAAALKHPNVADCYAVGEEGTAAYVAMELLKGKDLKALLHEKAAFCLENKLAIMIQIADGLDHAHKNGVVHGNLRAGNIHLGPDGIVKIRDFGFPVAAQGESRSYLAPEQILGKASDHRADIFSAGIVFYQLLTSVHPFVDPLGASDIQNRLLESHISTVERFPHIPVGFWPIIETCLQKDPVDRYSGMGQVGGAYRELLKDLAEDCELMIKQLRAVAPLLRRAVEMPGSGIKFALLMRRIESALAADAGNDHALLHSLTLSLVEYQGFLRLAAERMPASVPAPPVVMPYKNQAGVPTGSGSVTAESQPAPRSSAASTSAPSLDLGAAICDEAEFAFGGAPRHGLGGADAGASFAGTDLELDCAHGARVGGASCSGADLELDYAPADPVGEAGLDKAGVVSDQASAHRADDPAGGAKEERAPQPPLPPTVAEKNGEKLQSRTQAGDPKPLTQGPQAIQKDPPERRDPADVELAAVSRGRLPRIALRVGAAILLVLLAATLWMQVHALTSQTQMVLARLSLSQKRFDAGPWPSLAQAPNKGAAKAILEEQQKGKRQSMQDSLLREAHDLWARGQGAEAKARLQAVLELDPGSKPALRLLHQVTDVDMQKDLQRRVKNLLTSASALIKQGNLETAKAHLDLARQLLPEDREVLAARQGWAEKSADVFSQRQEAQQSTDWDAEQVRSAQELYRQGRYEEAQSLLERGLAENAKDAQVLRIRVAAAQRALKSYLAALSEQRYEDALNAFRKLEQVNPSDPTVAAVRYQLEAGKVSGKASAKALLTVYCLGEAGFVTLDGQRLDSDGEVENRSVVAGNHLLTVRNDRGFEVTRIQEFRADQNVLFVYDAANLVLREMRDGDQELLSNRKTTGHFPVEHVHSLPEGRCDGELVLSDAGVEYRPRSGAHAFRASLQRVKLRAEGKTIDLYDAADNKELDTFETADDRQAERLKQLWRRLESPRR